MTTCNIVPAKTRILSFFFPPSIKLLGPLCKSNFDSLPHLFLFFFFKCTFALVV
jgi:hypothetical protein